MSNDAVAGTEGGPSADEQGDIVTNAAPPLRDHERLEVMIPMRDGVGLHTVIIIPKGAANAPMILDRTPYGADRVTRLSGGPKAAMGLYAFHAELVTAGYILVLQDVRGKHRSDGVYRMNRPLKGALNPTQTDHATDAWDTVDWLVKSVSQSNGRVGAIGISYDGFTALMHLIDPHPQLAAVVAINPMVDNWVGDDWFHNGAFRQSVTAHYVHRQTASKASEVAWPAAHYDEYEMWLKWGSAGSAGQALGLDQHPFWNRLTQHPAYDDFWSAQALDAQLTSRRIRTPTLHVRSQWDSEDSYGPVAAFLAVEASGADPERNRLVIGPWTHTGVGFDAGDRLGRLRFGSDTAAFFRREIMEPFFAAHLKDGAPPLAGARVAAFETGSNTWRAYAEWPPKSPQAPAGRPLYLAPLQALSFAAPDEHASGAFDAFVSDPLKPVTYQPRPNRAKGPGSGWDEWLADDQRFAAVRPDVLVYTSDYLDAPIRLAGQPIAHLHAATTGTDVDWIVKLIDVYPDEVREDPALGGYQLPIAMEIFRGRYRLDPARPSAVRPGEISGYEIKLPHVSHAFLPGHRIMVQIQCTWFPLYDRNPQTFVDNIFFAQPHDYVKATQQVFRDRAYPSRITLPVVEPGR